MTDKNKNINKNLDTFLDNEDCNGEECKIKTDKSLVERINKKIVTDDGRQLLM